MDEMKQENANQPEQAGQAQPVAFSADKVIRPDGSFVEGWHQNLPDELKGEKSIQTFKSFPDLVKSYVNERKLVGKARLVAPGENSIN